MSAEGNFASTLSARARAQPDAVALIEPAARERGGWRAVRYSELDELTGRYATGFARAGLGSGDRVLYLLQPHSRAYAAFYALLRIGAVPVFVDPRMGLASLLRCIRETAPTVLLGGPLVHSLSLAFPRPFRALRLRITDGARWLWAGVRLDQCDDDSVHDAAAPTGRDAAGYLAYTSGSTGPAKAVLCTHGMALSQAESMASVCGWQAGMIVVMCYAPFVPYALADGLTVVLPRIDFTRPAAADPAQVMDAINTHAADSAFASPVIWHHVVRYAERAGLRLPTLERALTAGAPAPASLHRRLRPLLHPNGLLYTPYGATEAMPVTTTHSAEIEAALPLSRAGYGTYVGRPLQGVEVMTMRVTDEPHAEWCAELQVMGDEVGEIVVGGAIVSRTYPFQPTEDARAKIRRGDTILHRTGDLGRIAADGGMWFCGRKAQRIEGEAGMIAPVALENIFNEHPGMLRTAAVGSGVRGAQRVALCVELEPGVRFTPALVAELHALARGTSFEGVVHHILPHRGFPVDARHNAKIRRDLLAVWAERKLREGRRHG